MIIQSMTIDGSSYTISPQVTRGSTVTISITIKRESGDAGNGLRIRGGGGTRFTVVNDYDFLIASEGGTGTVSFSWTVPTDNAWINNNLSGNNTFIDPKWIVTLGIGEGSRVYSNTQRESVVNPCTYIKCNPQILEFDMVRATNGVANDEGESVLTTLRLSSYSSLGITGATLRLYYAVGTKPTTSSSYINLTSYISYAISYGYSNSTIISNTFQNEYDYEFLLVFTSSDGDSVSTEFELSRSFANVHLSAYENGGVCFGGFSTSDNESVAKFENYYPTYLYGGIAQIGALKNSLSAMGIQYGQSSSQKFEDEASFTITFEKPYLSVPCFYATPVSTLSGSNVGRLQTAIISVSSSTAQVGVYSASGSQTCYVNWLAIGTPNNDPNATIALTMPPSAMTSSSMNDCVVSASSTWSSSYPARKAFDFNTSTSWASDEDDSSPWIQIEMSTALKNIKVSVYARGNTSAINNPTAGNVQLSNTGSSWTTAAYYSGWDGSAYATLLGTIECKNTTAYQYVRLNITGMEGDEGYAAIGYISIEGEQ